MSFDLRGADNNTLTASFIYCRQLKLLLSSNFISAALEAVKCNVMWWIFAAQVHHQCFGHLTRTPHVTCTWVSCEHQSRACGIISHVASYGHDSASLWVEEEIRWHGHGVAAAQQHMAVSIWPYEACDWIAMKCPTDTQGPIRTWSEAQGEMAESAHRTVNDCDEDLSCFERENSHMLGGQLFMLISSQDWGKLCFFMI